jgi:hypothetical protein
MIINALNSAVQHRGLMIAALSTVLARSKNSGAQGPKSVA